MKNIKSLIPKKFFNIEVLRKIYSLILYKFDNREGWDKQLLDSLHNKYKGKRCFVVCNGPSLKAADLDVLKKHGEISLASNKIHKIYGQTDWRPTYYAVADGGFYKPLLHDFDNMGAEVKFFKKDSYWILRCLKTPCVFYDGLCERKWLDDPHFSEDARNGIYNIATITYTLFQLAVFLGMREIYIIGCDNFYGREQQRDGTIVNHGVTSYFKGADANDTQKNSAATWEMNIAYEYARKYADEHNIKIFNATRGGHLEAFKRADFDSLFKD